MAGMSKAERHEELRRQAEELAQTGWFPGWETIEIELNDQEAHAALDDGPFRDHLDQLSAAARKGRQGA